ncbi:hypothetical protein [Acinetobacter sp. B51(2017)]|uniref:hypothetical protein n=1 Tax=Acinetobacter sp. B51(2017) TaxID=2060938 RepID=UPI000F0970B7|nr:hypothetical protein [Acinetobacter sp. B51(2017)]
MQQTIKNSQTPEFDTNKTQTTPILYREPKPSEQGSCPKKKLMANLFDFTVFIAVAIVSWLVITVFLTAVLGG